MKVLFAVLVSQVQMPMAVRSIPWVFPELWLNKSRVAVTLRLQSLNSTGKVICWMPASLEQKSLQNLLDVERRILGVANAKSDVLEIAEQCHILDRVFRVHGVFRCWTAELAELPRFPSTLSSQYSSPCGGARYRPAQPPHRSRPAWASASPPPGCAPAGPPTPCVKGSPIGILERRDSERRVSTTTPARRSRPRSPR